MLKLPKIPSSEITPYDLYLNRRRFMTAAGSVAVGALALAGCGTAVTPAPASSGSATAPATGATGDLFAGYPPRPDALAYAEPFASSATDEIGAKLNTFTEIVNYNDYYEFSTNKEVVADEAKGFNPVPWTVEVSGLVNNPLTLDLDDIYSQFTQEERIYRLRCVEAWSMVIPWVGFSLGDLLKMADPKSDAQYVKFTSIMRPDEMRGQRTPMLDWPYVEGLRIDEAMNDLATLATGMYGQPLTNQQGAPFRLVVPWKYGFKSIKAVVKIELTDVMPNSTWSDAAPSEYGFFANVNPTVNHPRWSQASERRIGEFGRRETLLFNGYGEQVAALYDGMDLAGSF
jgi:sulfoxide reductase catalytic subunit YedY